MLRAQNLGAAKSWARFTPDRGAGMGEAGRMAAGQVRDAGFLTSTITSTDAYLHGRNFFGWDHEFIQLSNGHYIGRATQVWLGPVQIFHDYSNQAIEHFGHCWPGSLVFVSQLPGPATLRFDGRRLRDGTFTAHRWDDVERTSSNGPYETLGFAIGEEFLQDYYRDIAQSELPVDFPQRISQANPENLRDFQFSLMQIIRSQSEQCAADGQSARADIFLDGVLVRLVRGIDGESWDEKPPTRSTREYIVDKAVEYIEANLAGDVRIANICRMLKISYKSLEYSFQEIKGVTPTRYVLMRKLAAVRRSIITGEPLIQISEHAARWGFTHMGRFGQAYRAIFGETPSQTRLRYGPPVRPG